MAEDKPLDQMSAAEHLQLLRDAYVAQRRELVLQTLLFRSSQADSPLDGHKVKVIQEIIKAIDEAISDEGDLDPPKSAWEAAP